MARGDTENGFAKAAAGDGIILERAKVPWLNRRGHLGIDDLPASTQQALDTIFESLGGNRAEQRAKALTALPGDFYHRASGTFIEIDESQHFTSFRAESLALYPDDAPLGFELDHYQELCEVWAPKSDKYFASKAATAFGVGGRQRQRAYNDALRDLVIPALGHPPLIRVAAPERDAVSAYASVRQRLQSLK